MQSSRCSSTDRFMFELQPKTPRNARDRTPYVGTSCKRATLPNRCMFRSFSKYKQGPSRERFRSNGWAAAWEMSFPRLFERRRLLERIRLLDLDRRLCGQRGERFRDARRCRDSYLAYTVPSVTPGPTGQHPRTKTTHNLPIRPRHLGSSPLGATQGNGNSDIPSRQRDGFLLFRDFTATNMRLALLKFVTPHFPFLLLPSSVSVAIRYFCGSGWSFKLYDFRYQGAF